MIITKKIMKNIDIYNIANALLENFQDEIGFPVRINFYFQKNLNELVAKAQEVEAARFEIFDKYGTKDEETNQYTFAEDIIETANQELSDLFELEQEVKVHKISVEDFGDIVLTNTQMNAIAFMFEEEE